MFENFKVPSELMPTDARFGVGPSLVPKVFIERLAQVSEKYLGTSHRKPFVKNIVQEAQDGMRKYFNLPSDYEIVLGNGGATFLFDMIGLGLVEKSSLHFTPGEFSSKWYKSHKNIPWISAEEVNCPFGENINPYDKEGFDMICCTLNETSTGVMLTELPDVDEDTLLAVDATSGAGQIKVDFQKVDLYFFSPQKVFASEGGFYVCIMSPKAIKRYEDLKNRETYIPNIMRWEFAIENSRKAQTYNTPSLSTIFYLNEQVKLMNELGEDKVIAQAGEKAQHLYTWADSKDYLSCFVKEEKFRSIAVATINLAEKYPVNDLLKVLREQDAVYDIEAYRKLGLNQMRISLFHNVSLDNLKKLTQIIDLAIESVG